LKGGSALLKGDSALLKGDSALLKGASALKCFSLSSPVFMILISNEKKLTYFLRFLFIL